MPVFKNVYLSPRICTSVKALSEILLMNNAASLGRVCTVFPFSSTDICSSGEHWLLFSPHMQKMTVLNLAKQTLL